MIIDTDNIFSVTQANQNFSAVERVVDRDGKAVIFKNNKPKYIIADVENGGVIFDLTEEEKFEIVAKRILNRYLPAFKELAK